MANTDLTNYGVVFRAPPLPMPPETYNKASAVALNNILRLYFNKIDDALRNDTLNLKSEAVAWFLS